MSFLEDHGISGNKSSNKDIVLDKIGSLPISNDRLVVLLDSENILAVEASNNVFIYNLRTFEKKVPTGNIVNYQNDMSYLHSVVDMGSTIFLMTYGKFVIYDKKTLNKIKIIDHKTFYDNVLQAQFITKTEEEALLIHSEAAFIFNLKTLAISAQVTFEERLPPFKNDFIEGDLLYCCDRKIKAFNYRTGKLVKSADIVPSSLPVYTLCGYGRFDNYIGVVYYAIRENNTYYIQILSKDTLKLKYEYGRENIWTEDPTVVQFANQKRFVILNGRYSELKVKRKRGKEKFFLRSDMNTDGAMKTVMRTLSNEKIGVLLDGSINTSLLIYLISKE